MGAGHPECPQRLDAIEDRLLISGLDIALERREATAAAIADLELAHTRMHLASLRGLSEQLREDMAAGGPGRAQVDPDTSINTHSWDAILMAAGAAIDATDAVMAGELANAFVMARMKVWSEGKHLWTRTIGSTVVGQGVDSLLFYPLAFLGVWSTGAVVTVLITNYLLKVAWEAILTPVTYQIVGFLKRAQGVDIYDRNTNFTPFSVRS